MSAYTGSLRIQATDDVVEAEFRVSEQTLTVISGGQQLGTWPLSNIELDDTGTEIYLSLDGEEVIVNVPNRDAFVDELAPPRGKRGPRHAKPRRQKTPKAPRAAKRPKSRKPVKPSAPPEPAELVERTEPRLPTPAKPPRDVLGAVRRLLDRDTWREWLADRVVRWVIAATVVIGVALLALFATASLGMILVLIGMVALIVAALAVSEDLTAISWVPGQMSESTLVIAGAVAMVIGGLLIVLG